MYFDHSRGQYGLLLVASWLVVLSGMVDTEAADAEDGPADKSAAADYLRDVKPLLAAKCVSCHGPLAQEGDLRLDTAAAMRAGGASGPAIVPGKPGESLLLHKVASEDADLRMPPADAGARLTAEQLAVLTRWITRGAVAPEEQAAADPRDHWAFQPPAKIEIPAVETDWIRNDIDRFIAREHQQLGLTAVDPARPEVLLRRVYLDLIGLPPTREQLRDFLADPSPTAYERVVDDLLSSPRYGERWARHWMDVWRYSDPSGYGKEIRDSREHIWRWRDWIIESLNEDKPYDRMIVEMLAADEAAPTDLRAARATGFLARNWYKFNRNVWLDNIVEHSSKAFLGTTLNCSRCHDHKYDPIAQREYYRMRAVFETHDVRDDPLPGEADALLVRAYDAHLDRPTYEFAQGDENRPLEDEPLTPAVPSVLGGELDIRPIALPVEAWYPALRPEMREARQAELEARIEAARRDLEQKREEAVRAAELLAGTVTSGDASSSQPEESNAERSKDETVTQPSVVLSDNFSKLDPATWVVESGEWSVKEGRLRQQAGQSVQQRLVSRLDHPRNFRVRARLRITGGEQYRSVGIGFDVQGKQMHSVYLSANAGGPKVQFTLQDASGSWSYPAEAAAPQPLELDRDYSLELAVRDSLVNVLLDDKLLITYTLPADRKAGKLCLWTFSATAEFDELVVSELPAGEALVGTSGTAAPHESLDTDDAQTTARVTKLSAEAAAAELAAREVELESFLARSAAECAKYGLSERDVEQLAREASRAERRHAVRRLEADVARDQHQLAVATRPSAKEDAKAKAAREKAEKDLATRQKQLAKAQKKLEEESTGYQSLGPQYPRTSSGRRLALARWLTSPDNPLTARVAVNHIWMRHFDQPLVERVFDFGLRSDRPRFADLLDWLALRFVRDGWSMKQLHKLIVTSGVYRLSSATVDAPARNREQDPDNLAFWHMNARRMEAEVVRDSLLHAGNSLDRTMGGAPIDHQQGQAVMRRSIYFRQDKERQMTFLSLFDGAKVNECYERKSTVAPQQALAMFNSRIAWEQAVKLADRWSDLPAGEFIEVLYEHLLSRQPSAAEHGECLQFLEDLPDAQGARRQLALVLLNHHDFVTIR